jgi:hypothetical protein
MKEDYTITTDVYIFIYIYKTSSDIDPLPQKVSY